MFMYTYFSMFLFQDKMTNLVQCTNSLYNNLELSFEIENPSTDGYKLFQNYCQ